MANYNIPQAQKELYDTYIAHKNQGIVLTESQLAAEYAKILIRQANAGVATFCADKEMFIAKNPVGYAITGYYLDMGGNKKPFQITVCNQGGQWSPARDYVAADTKRGSNFILLWILLMAGSTLFGLIMYYIISAAVGL